MMTRYEAWLDKKGLSAIDPSVYILDIAYSAPRMMTNAVDIAGRNGQRVISRLARNTSVVITLEIHEQDTARRQDVCRRVQAWAMGGGILTVNDRPGQRLCVICDSPPEISSALKWTQPLKVTLTAYEQPFWEDEYPRSVTLNGTSDRKTLYVPGIGAETRTEVKVSNTSSMPLDALTIKAGGTTMEFEGLSLGAGEMLEIDYDEHALLRIRAGGVSKMSCRTAASDDELLLKTGKASEVSVQADGPVSALIRTRGLYL